MEIKLCMECGKYLSLDNFHKHKGRRLGVTDRCKPCRNNKLPLAVDHCHSTGKVRGLLFYNCNNGLGIFKDNIESLKNAINYLKESKK